MCQNCLVKTIHSVNSHFGWDARFAPVERVVPGTTLQMNCKDSSNGYFTAHSQVADVGAMPFDQINPVTGPIYIEGAEPGDILKITLDSFEPGAWNCSPISSRRRPWPCGTTTPRAWRPRRSAPSPRCH
jgi:acetamidase/formamidase